MDVATPVLRLAAVPALGVPRSGRPAAVARRLSAAVADPLWVVLAAWAACVAGLFFWIQRDAIPLPFCDEYCFVPIACGQRAVTAAWLWEPANEHRAPLLRLYLVGLGTLAEWDFQAMLRINLYALAAGVLFLVVAARAARGRSAVADCCLPFVALSPAGFDTIVLYSYAYAPVFCLLCAALALAATGAIYRSAWAWSGYAAIAAAVALAGGPAGQLWALALLSAAPLVWRERALGRGRHAAPLAAAVVGGIVAVLLYSTPHQPLHDHFRVDSPAEVAELAAKHAVGWLGLFPLLVLWPYLGIAALVPVAYAAGRAVAGLAGACAGGGPYGAALDRLRWLPLAAVLAATLALCAVIGHARGPTMVWTSRYQFMLAPIPLVALLLLARFHAPRGLSDLLLVVSLFAYGWNWPTFQANAAAMAGGSRRPLVWALQAGYHPLSQLAQDHPAATGWNAGLGTQHLVGWWMDLRDRRLSAFRKLPPDFPARAFAVADGELGRGLKVVADPDAVRSRAVECVGWADARASFRFPVPAERRYDVWVRCRADEEGRLTARLDGGPEVEVEPGAAAAYGAIRLMSDKLLSAGEHVVEVGLPTGNVRVDLVEVVAQPQTPPGTGPN